MARGGFPKTVARRCPAALAAAILLVFALAAPRGAGGAPADPVGQLRREKARLTEMKRKAEAAAAELAVTIGREKTARNRVEVLQAKLTRQRREIERINRKLKNLGEALERAEGEIRVLEEERSRAGRGLSKASARLFRETKDAPWPGPSRIPDERLRHFAGLFLMAETGRVARLDADKERTAGVISGIEHRLEMSEDRIEREKSIGRTLLSRREAQEKELEGIKARKAAKEKELRSLRARVARLETLLARIERKVRARDRRTAGARKGVPARFSALPGGLVPPLAGKVVAPFGSRHDPVFDVTVENHGVEIEAAGGTPIRSVGRAEVAFSGGVQGFGKVLILQHGDGLFSVYGKAASFRVKAGQTVAAGEVVGALPGTSADKSVLYLELRAAGAAIDPASVIPFPR